MLEIKKWLNRAYELDQEINILLRARQHILYPFSDSCEGEKVQISKQNTSDARFAMYADYGKRIDELTDQLYDTRQEIGNAINKLDVLVQRQVLRERYLNRRRWWQIANITGYSEQHIYRVHNRALKNITRVLDYGSIAKMEKNVESS